MTSGDDVVRNLRRAGELVGEAVALGAELVVLPERWAHIDGRATLRGAEALEGPALSTAREWAREHGVHLLAGSIAEATPEGDRAYNTSVLIGPTGAIDAIYRKIHLFDVSVGGREYRESRFTVAGSDPVVGEVAGRTVGLSICYDVRFPELYRALVDRGAEILTVPAAFTRETGRDHWEPLLRARAIENQCFVVAAGQWGEHPDGSVSYGRSMIIDPWGTVLAQASDGEGVACARLDFAALEAIRARLPALGHRRIGR